MHTKGVDADQVDVHRVQVNGIRQCAEIVAGNPDGANLALLLRFQQHVDHGTHIDGPLFPRHAVYQQRVDRLYAKFLARAFDVGLSDVGILGARLGQHEHLIAREFFQGGGDKGVRAVGQRGINVANATIVRFADHADECVLPKVAHLATAIHAGADAKHGRFDPRLTQGNQIGAALGLCRRGDRGLLGQSKTSGQQCRAGRQRRGCQKLAA